MTQRIVLSNPLKLSLLVAVEYTPAQERSEVRKMPDEAIHFLFAGGCTSPIVPSRVSKHTMKMRGHGKALLSILERRSKMVKDTNDGVVLEGKRLPAYLFEGDL